MACKRALEDDDVDLEDTQGPQQRPVYTGSDFSSSSSSSLSSLIDPLVAERFVWPVQEEIKKKTQKEEDTEKKKEEDLQVKAYLEKRDAEEVLKTTTCEKKLGRGWWDKHIDRRSDPFMGQRGYAEARKYRRRHNAYSRYGLRVSAEYIMTIAADPQVDFELMRQHFGTHRIAMNHAIAYDRPWDVMAQGRNTQDPVKLIPFFAAGMIPSACASTGTLMHAKNYSGFRSCIVSIATPEAKQSICSAMSTELGSLMRGEALCLPKVLHSIIIDYAMHWVSIESGYPQCADCVRLFCI